MRLRGLSVALFRVIRRTEAAAINLIVVCGSWGTIFMLFASCCLQPQILSLLPASVWRFYSPSVSVFLWLPQARFAFAGLSPIHYYRSVSGPLQAVSQPRRNCWPRCKPLWSCFDKHRHSCPSQTPISLRSFRLTSAAWLERWYDRTCSLCTAWRLVGYS